MKKRPVPTDWWALRPGDRIATTIPLHRAEAHFAAMAEQGYAFTAEPSPRGYWILCVAAPDTTTQSP